MKRVKITAILICILVGGIASLVFLGLVPRTVQSQTVKPTPTPKYGEPAPIPASVETNPSTKISKIVDLEPGVSSDNKATVVVMDADGTKEGILTSMDKTSEVIKGLVKDQILQVVIPPSSIFEHNRAPINVADVVSDSVDNSANPIPATISVPPTPVNKP